MTESRTRGLPALAELLPPAKARLALRLWCAGREPVPADFDRRGITLSDEEAARLRLWLQSDDLPLVRDAVRSSDGTERLVLQLTDGQFVETVSMPVGAVCVSTQVGCAVGCRFCASGLDGVKRNLTAEEMVAQLAMARRRMRIDRVVFMGMGEPSHNLDAVLDAVASIKRDALIGPKRQTVSTVGSIRTFERMAAAPVRPCLALSLHKADDAGRRLLLPRAHRDSLPDLVAAADAYGRGMGMPVQFEWTLLAGVNDSAADVDALCELLQGVRGYVNFIVWNPVADLPFSRPDRQRVVSMVRSVKARGILATIRDSAGVDVGAACGQLRRLALTSSGQRISDAS